MVEINNVLGKQNESFELIELKVLPKLYDPAYIHQEYYKKAFDAINYIKNNYKTFRNDKEDVIYDHLTFKILNQNSDGLIKYYVYNPLRHESYIQTEPLIQEKEDYVFIMTLEIMYTIISCDKNTNDTNRMHKFQKRFLEYLQFMEPERKEPFKCEKFMVSKKEEEEEGAEPEEESKPVYDLGAAEEEEYQVFDPSGGRRHKKTRRLRRTRRKRTHKKGKLIKRKHKRHTRR